MVDAVLLDCLLENPGVVVFGGVRFELAMMMPKSLIVDCGKEEDSLLLSLTRSEVDYVDGCVKRLWPMYPRPAAGVGETSKVEHAARQRGVDDARCMAFQVSTCDLTWCLQRTKT